MRIPLSALLISTLLLAGCGNSRLNPMNWFGRAQSQPVATENANPLIPATRRGLLARKKAAPYAGTLIHEVTTLKVERVPGGAIVRASGVGLYQGQYDVKLISPTKKQAEKGVLTFEFRAILPEARTRVQGSEWSRTLTVATFLTENELAGVRSIRVQGANNVMTTRR